jgi:hypothetical protein
VKSHAGILLTSSLLLLVAGNVVDAYGHGPGPSLTSWIIRIDNEQFSDNTFGIGELGIINGELENFNEDELRLTIKLYVTPSQTHTADDTQLGEIPWYYQYLSTVYPPFRDQSVMYFRFESMPDSVVLEPGESKPYEIKFYPLKAGVYHVHTNVVTEDGSRIARGQTIIVDGEGGYTEGEIFQLYIPVTLFLATAAIMTMILIRIIRPSGWKDIFVRFFFVFKSSYETMLLSGVAFSLLLTPYLPINSLALVVGLAVALGAIIIGSYISVVARSHNRIIAISTSAATVIFYFVLLMSGCSHTYSQCYPFTFDDSIVFLVVVGNAISAGLIAILTMREQRRLTE